MHPEILNPHNSNNASSSTKKRRPWIKWVYLFTIHLIVAILLIAPELVERLNKFLYKTPYSEREYRGMVSAHVVQVASLPADSAVFLGDSILRGLNLSQVTSLSGYNLSIGGDTTIGLLWRLPKYRNIGKARLVVLAIGVNDLSHTSDEVFLDHYDRVLTELERLQVRNVFAFAMLPIDERTYEQANAAALHGHRLSNQRIDRCNLKLAEVCARHPIVRFVNLADSMRDETGNLASEYTAGGLHLTDQGYQAWSREMQKHLVNP